MLPQPLHDNTCEIDLLTQSQSTPTGYTMPLLQAATTTASRGVLGDKRRENSMAHGGLLAVIGNESWCQPPGNGLTCTLLYLFHPLAWI